MDKQAQIEEMVTNILPAACYTRKELVTVHKYAEALYAAGYRKVERMPVMLLDVSVKGPFYKKDLQKLLHLQRDADYRFLMEGKGEKRGLTG